MQIGQTIDRQTSKRAIKRAVICSLVVMTVFGAIIADTLTKQREASGEVVLELCKKSANGQWVVIDRTKGTVTASASVLDVARGKEFKSNLKWDPRSEQGRQISLKQAGSGKATVDPASGEVNLEIPFDVSVDGKTLSLTAKLTNKSVSTPLGTLPSKKLETSGTTLSTGVAGFVEIKEPSVVEHLVREPNQQAKGPTAGAKEPTSGVKVSPQQNNKEQKNPAPTPNKGAGVSLIVVIKAQGSAKG